MVLACMQSALLCVCGSKDPRYDSRCSWRRSLDLPDDPYGLSIGSQNARKSWARLLVIGTPTVMFGAASGQVGPVRQLWEYRNVTIPSGQDPTALLNAAGADGWEATGVTVGAQGATLVLMKRPQN
jgi:hypothetical protein